MLASPALGKRSRMMVRRNRQKFVLTALIALALQIFAPGWAVMAMAARYFDPIANAIVCSEHPELDGKSVPRHGHEAVCPICQFACHHTGYAVFASSPGSAAPAQMGWVSHHRYHIAAPRGPPGRFAQARAPPTLL
jgi:hypothetical protein